PEVRFLRVTITAARDGAANSTLILHYVGDGPTADGLVFACIEVPDNLTRRNLTASTFDRLSGSAKTTASLALMKSRKHGGYYRFLPVRCDHNRDHYHRQQLSVGTLNGSSGLWCTGWRRNAFASISIR